MKQRFRTLSCRRWRLLAPLSAAIGGMAAMSTPQAATVRVANCNDTGSGSLRAAIARAGSGDAIDLTALACNRITLVTGQLVVAQDDLTLVGKGRFALTIDGNRASRVFLHAGEGTLHLHRLSVANGYVAVEAGAGASALGGCIVADRLVLTRSRVHHCEAFSPGDLDTNAAGGAIFASSVLLSHSSVFANHAAGRAEGGGIYAGRVSLYRSQVYGNDAPSGGGIYGAGGVDATYSLIHGNRAGNLGGGIYVERGELRLNKSTVSANAVVPGNNTFGTDPMGGGLFATADARAVIVDSTLSGNAAYQGSAALLDGPATVFNSTIAFNREGASDSEDCGLLGAFHAQRLRAHSSIFARNACSGGPTYDISANGTTAITGADNLVGRPRNPVPADTLLTTEPRLLPLAEYGGPVRTHALRSDSPAIERGSNPLGRDFDQRGPGFPRVRGAFPDIGAVER